MIDNELLEEVISLSLNEEFITLDLLKRIIKNIIDKCSYSTKTQFNGIVFFEENKESKRTNASYDGYNKLIKIYYLSMIKNCIYFNKFNIFQTNLYMLQAILHEIEHLKQDTDEEIDDFTKKLNKYSSQEFIYVLLLNKFNEFRKNKEDSTIVTNYIIKKTRKFYHKNWELIPKEKLAETNSAKILLDSINVQYNFKLRNPKEYEFILQSYFYSLKMGYKYNKKENIYNCPLIQYLNKLDKIGSNVLTEDSIMQEIKNMENCSLEHRMKYGLPIENDELEKMKQKIFTKGTI